MQEYKNDGQRKLALNKIFIKLFQVPKAIRSVPQIICSVRQIINDSCHEFATQDFVFCKS